MLDILASTLKSALQLALVLALLSAYLETTRRKDLLQPLNLAILTGLMGAAGLAYGIRRFLDREVMEGAASLLGAILIIVLIVWIGSTRNVVLNNKMSSRKTRLASWSLVFGAVAVLVTLGGLNIALAPTRVFTQASGLLSTDWAVNTSAVFAGIALAALIGMILRKVVRKVGTTWITLATTLSLFILLIQSATTVVQVMLVRGMLPLADWLFSIVVPLINNYPAFYYALVATACIVVALAAWEQRQQKHALEGLNPAQERKIKAASGRLRALMAAAGGLLALVFMVDGASAWYANRPLDLSPATPVARSGDSVIIPVDSVSDGALHRFSYETEDGTVVRFLMIHKGSGVYGVGLDACEFCGVAGYRQDGNKVICNRCDAAINVATVGFPGGCNPVPLRYVKEGDSVVVSVEALEAAKGVFGR